MSSVKRHVTIMVHTEGVLEARSVRMPLWLFRLLTGTAISVFVVISLAAVLYTPIVRTAVKVPGLSREVERLSAENQQVHQLAAQLVQVEDRYMQLRGMLGANIIPELQNPDSVLPIAAPLLARYPNSQPCYETGTSRPRYWPLGGPSAITRGPVGVGSSTEVHAGLDVAVAQGTAVLASGGGRVLRAGYDSEYGFFVRIAHTQRHETMYGHLSRPLVVVGETVQAGQVIGLSGSTGRSTAPHLHFEIFVDGESIDPSLLISQECSNGNILYEGG
jgi:murein DD-endopeptidase MepM/ murein hydrolase activator NlpD